MMFQRAGFNTGWTRLRQEYRPKSNQSHEANRFTHGNPNSRSAKPDQPELLRPYPGRATSLMFTAANTLDHYAITASAASLDQTLQLAAPHVESHLPVGWDFTPDDIQG
jgi:hypothetical protein